MKLAKTALLFTLPPVSGTPPVYWQGQNGMLGVFLSPHYSTDQSIYLTYAEPGDYGGGLALARAHEHGFLDRRSSSGAARS